jgi:hypothetical protein
MVAVVLAEQLWMRLRRKRRISRATSFSQQQQTTPAAKKKSLETEAVPATNSSPLTPGASRQDNE